MAMTNFNRSKLEVPIPYSDSMGFIVMEFYSDSMRY